MQTDRFSAAMDAFKLWRSGVFSAQAYRRANPDIGGYPATLHYRRHGHEYGREHNQTALSQWLSTAILAGAISPTQAARIAEEIEATGKSQLARTHGLNLSDYALLSATRNWDAEAAQLHSGSASPEVLVSVAHAFADKTNALFLAEPAINSALNTTSSLDTTRLRQALDLAIAKGRRDACGVLGNVLVQRVRNRGDVQAFGAAIPLFMTDASAGVAQQVQELGLGPTLASSERTRQLADLPEYVLTLFSLATAHSLGMGSYIFDPIGRDVVKVADNSREVRDRAIHIRLLRPNYWVTPQREHPVTGAALVVQKAFLFACLRDGVPIIPTFATTLFDITDEDDHGVPTFSYHSFTRRGRKAPTLHYKESYLPGLMIWDTEGYSGWSSLADATPDQLPEIPIDVAESYRNKLFSEFVSTNKSKYEQSGEIGELPHRAFIFAALQVPDDTVAALAYMKREEWLPALTRAARSRNIPLVVKAHPKDASEETADLLDRIQQLGAQVSTAPIHTLISKSACVVTVNSGVGFEALLHPRPVITLGACDYAAATLPARSVEELEARLTQVLAGSIIDRATTNKMVWMLGSKRAWSVKRLLAATGNN